MVGNSGRRRTSDRAMAICDRSGGKYPMSEMVVEPGTHLLVHRRFSDGMWNPVDHPANNIQKYASFGDPFPVENARPDRNWSLDAAPFLTDATGQAITDATGNDLETESWGTI